MAHDFDELLSDFESGHLQNYRVRRDDGDDKCHKKFTFCCANEVLNKIHKEKWALKKECFKEVVGEEFSKWSFDPFTCDGIEKRKSDMIVSTTLSGLWFTICLLIDQ